MISGDYSPAKRKTLQGVLLVREVRNVGPMLAQPSEPNEYAHNEPIPIHNQEL